METEATLVPEEVSEQLSSVSIPISSLFQDHVKRRTGVEIPVAYLFFSSFQGELADEIRRAPARMRTVKAEPDIVAW